MQLFVYWVAKVPANIHGRMKRQDGNTCMLLQQLCEWLRKFKREVSVLTGAARSDRLDTANGPDAKAEWNEQYRKTAGNNQ